MNIDDVITKIGGGDIPNLKEISTEDFANHPFTNALECTAVFPFIKRYNERGVCLVARNGFYAGCGLGWVSVPKDTDITRRLLCFQFVACDHNYKSYPKGNCLYEYKCKICGNSYKVDSSG